MPTLTISDFSCIKQATIDLKPVTIIIGPQGSGKSVTTKMFYFLSEVVGSHISSAERGDSLEDFKRSIGARFREWFPPSAWGPKRFNIAYHAGSFTIRILRRMKKGKPSDELAITFSEWFERTYRQTSRSFAKIRSEAEELLTDDNHFTDPLDRAFRVREVVDRSMSAQLGSEYISSQTFIPAGRAYFTSIGRLVAGFENIGTLDPVTIRFAKRFANLRDRNMSRTLRNRIRRDNPETANQQDFFMKRLFDGEVVIESEREYVRATDGRIIPFTSLSSGQQEVLPIWAMLDYFGQLDHVRRNVKRRFSETLYIEEPESHLFPSAQSVLLEFLFGTLDRGRGRRSIIITTHSPYIMGRINVYLKAGNLARRKKKNTAINDVVPRALWINERDLNAFAIVNGRLQDIVDQDDGLIDSSYLDSISRDIVQDFDKLLKIEMAI